LAFARAQVHVGEPHRSMMLDLFHIQQIRRDA
jgi:hypothetical protein